MRHGVDTTFLVAVEVACHPYHAVARALAETLRQNGDRFAITPQVSVFEGFTCLPTAAGTL